MEKLQPERGREPVAHRRQTVRHEERLRQVHRHALTGDRFVETDVTRHERVLGQRGAQLRQDLL
jgi:hypothetical protein